MVAGLPARCSDRIGGLRALGLSLLLFVLLGPVVQPWYLTWGIVLLAPVVTGRLAHAVIVLSVVSPFIGLPGGSDPARRADPHRTRSLVAAVMVLWSPWPRPARPLDRLVALDRPAWRALPAPRRRAPPGVLDLSRPDGARAPGRRSGGSEQELELDHVEPLAVLAPDLALDAHQLEAAGRCRPIETSLWPTMRAITEWKPWAAARASSSPSRALPDPAPRWRPVHVDRVLDGGGVGRAVAEGGERPEAEHRLAAGPASGRRGRLDGHRPGGPRCARDQATCSAGVRGTRSKVLVLSSTSTL